MNEVPTLQRLHLFRRAAHDVIAHATKQVHFVTQLTQHRLVTVRQSGVTSDVIQHL